MVPAASPSLFPRRTASMRGRQPATGSIAIFLIHQPKGLQGGRSRPPPPPPPCRHLGRRATGCTWCRMRRSRRRMSPGCDRSAAGSWSARTTGSISAAIGRRSWPASAEGSRPTGCCCSTIQKNLGFPSCADCDMLDRLEALGADLAGPVHYAQPQSEARRICNPTASLFSARAVESPAPFARSGRAYAMSNKQGPHDPQRRDAADAGVAARVVRASRRSIDAHEGR